MPALSKARPPPEEASAFLADGCGQNAGPASFFAKYAGLGFSAHRRPGCPYLVYARRLGSDSARCLEDSRAYPMPEVFSQIAVD